METAGRSAAPTHRSTRPCVPCQTVDATRAIEGAQAHGDTAPPLTAGEVNEAKEAGRDPRGHLSAAQRKTQFGLFRTRVSGFYA